MYDTILVPVDGSSASTASLAEAIKLAALSRGRLHLMNIVDDLHFDGDAGTASASALHDVVRERGEAVLQYAKEQGESAGITVTTSIVSGNGAGLEMLVVREAEACGADLIVLGTHGGRGLSRLFMGSDSRHLLNHVAIPVLLVRSESEESGVSVVELSATDSMFGSL